MTAPDRSDKSPTPAGSGAGGAAGSSGSSLGDPVLRAAVIYVAIVGLALAVLGLALFDLRTAGGVLLGGLLATANLMVFVRVSEAFLTGRGRTPWGVVAALKLVFLFGAVWIILRSGVVSGLALAAGYASMPIGITLGSLFGPRPPDDDADTGGPGAKRS